MLWRYIDYGIGVIVDGCSGTPSGVTPDAPRARLVSPFVTVTAGGHRGRVAALLRHDMTWRITVKGKVAVWADR